MCEHPPNQNVLNFMQLFGTFDKIVCSCPPAYFKVQWPMEVGLLSHRCCNLNE